MKYSEIKTGDWFKVAGRHATDIYIKAQDGMSYCIDSNIEDNIGEIISPDDDPEVYFVSHFWLHNFGLISVFERVAMVFDGEDYIPQRFIVKYPNGDRYYLTVSRSENLYLSFGTTEVNDYLLLGHYEYIQAINLEELGFVSGDIELNFSEKKKLKKAVKS